MVFSGKMRPGKLDLLLLCAAALAPPVAAQKVVSAKAGLITYLQGPAFVDGKRVILKSTRFPQMKDGETLSTGRGRAELLLAPGVVLRLAENSQMRMDDTQLADTRIAILRGEALIEIIQLPDNDQIHVASAETVTDLTRNGLYRFGTAQNGIGSLRVYGGEAVLQAGSKTVSVKRGMSAGLDSDLGVTKFDRKKTDALHAWSARRSFELFMSDPEARQRQNHWQLSGGYAENKNFGVVFRVAVRGRMPPPAIRSVPPAEVGPSQNPIP